MKDLNPEELINHKLARSGGWYLQEACVVQYEFKGMIGHPSGYAFVKFECEPMKSLKFKSSVVWPSECGGPTCIRQFEEFICEGICDGLVAASSTPYLGCALNLVDIRWDEVSSSAHAYYRATKGAMEELVRLGRWGPRLPESNASDVMGRRTSA